MVKCGPEDKLVGRAVVVWCGGEVRAGEGELVWCGDVDRKGRAGVAWW